MAKITFLKSKVVFNAIDGSDLLSVQERHPYLPLKFGCKRGECGVCMIEMLSGQDHLTKLSPEEQKTLQRKNAKENCRLACQCALNGDIEINS